MSYITVEKASILTGKSIPTIYRHIKSGKLSKHDDGIDTTELLRVYGPFKDTNEFQNTINMMTTTSVDNNTELELQRLRTEINGLTTQIEDLRHDKQKLYEVIDGYQRLIGVDTPVKKGLFNKLFSK